MPELAVDLASGINIDHIVTEDNTAVDNLESEKHMRLLTEPLYASWPGPTGGGPFLAAANVGVFFAVHEPPVVPDMFLSLGVKPAKDIREKRNRSYFLWEFGKPPDVVVEIVSNREGNEAGSKLSTYARIGVSYYAIFDPLLEIQPQALRVYELRAGRYEPLPNGMLEGVELSLRLWDGVFEGMEGTWLRWFDRHGALIPTGKERAEQEQHRAEQESQRAGAAEQRAERLAARLRELGLDPDSA